MKKQPSRFAAQLESATQKHPQEQQRSTADTFRSPEASLNAQINVRVSAEFRDEVKAYCALTGTSLQELITTLLTDHMQQNPVNR